jgi:hypothetical protein
VRSETTIHAPAREPVSPTAIALGGIADGNPRHDPGDRLGDAAGGKVRWLIGREAGPLGVRAGCPSAKVRIQLASSIVLDSAGAAVCRCRVGLPKGRILR